MYIGCEYHDMSDSGYDRAQHARAGGNVSLAASELERAVHDYPEFGKG